MVDISRVPALKVEHITESDLSIEGTTIAIWPASLPTSKPASPQISETLGPLNDYSKFCRATARSIKIADGTATIIYCEVKIDGVSQGTKSDTPGTSNYFIYGDYDPLASHLIEAYFWINSGTWYVSVNPYLRVGTVSAISKTVFKRIATRSSIFVFSTAGIVDSTHIYLDLTLVDDYDLWWSGKSLNVKGTDFEIEGDLIYQKARIV